MLLAAVVAAAFFMGAFAGVLVLLRVAMIGDKRNRRLPDNPRGCAAAAGRMVAGLHVCRGQPPARAVYPTSCVIPRQRPAAIHPAAISRPADDLERRIEKSKRPELP